MKITLKGKRVFARIRGMSRSSMSVEAMKAAYYRLPIALIPRLSKEEGRVFKMRIDGSTHREASKALGITERASRNTVDRILAKLRVAEAQFERYALDMEKAHDDGFKAHGEGSRWDDTPEYPDRPEKIKLALWHAWIGGWQEAAYLNGRLSTQSWNPDTASHGELDTECRQRIAAENT